MKILEGRLVSRGTLACIRCRGVCRCTGAVEKYATAVPALLYFVDGQKETEAEEWERAREHGERVARYLERDRRERYG